jgi:formate hydrogenlyase subunit 3/multisubunit Na+/H+ antiporter MnhD subunit
MGAVPVVYLLRRMGTGGLVASGVALFSAWLAMQLSTGVMMNLLGRPIEFDRLSQITVALLFGAAGILFLSPPLLAPAGHDLRGAVTRTRRGQTFYPLGLITLALFVAASLSRHLGITALLIEAAAILTVLIIQGGRLESTRAALRFLILMSLVTPIFLLTAWRIDLYQLSGGLESAQNLRQVALLASVGFALWLGVIPFHSWLTTTAVESSPPAATFVLIAFPAVAFSTLIHTLIDFPWLVNSARLVEAIIIAGVLTAVVAGVWASFQRGFSELMGYTALYDLGCTVAALGTGGQAGVITIVGGLTIRALALVLLAASLSAMRLRITSDGFAQAKGLAYQMPVTILGLLVGGLTLTGAPFTAGFAVRWQLLSSIGEAAPYWPALLTMAGLGVVVGYLRGLRMALAAPETAKSKPATVSEPSSLLLMIGLLSLACFILGVFPSLWLAPLQTWTAGISIPIR